MVVWFTDQRSSITLFYTTHRHGLLLSLRAYITAESSYADATVLLMEMRRIKLGMQYATKL